MFNLKKMRFLPFTVAVAKFTVASLLISSHAYGEDNTSLLNDTNQIKKTSIQKLVDNHIDSLFLDSKIFFVDFDSSKPVSAVPIDIHPMIFAADQYFVACITVIDDEGIEYPVDIYIFENKSELIVSDIKFGNRGRSDLIRLMEMGLVSKF